MIAFRFLVLAFLASGLNGAAQVISVDQCSSCCSAYMSVSDTGRRVLSSSKLRGLQSSAFNALICSSTGCGTESCDNLEDGSSARDSCEIGKQFMKGRLVEASNGNEVGSLCLFLNLATD